MRLLPALLLLVVPALSQSIKAPEGSMVLIDGRLEPSEWNDARKLELAPGHNLYVKQHPGYVLIAYEHPDAASFSVDLFLKSGSAPVINLHASAQLGERTMRPDGTFPDWKWRNHTGWTSHVLARVGKDGFEEHSVKEFQIRRSKLPGKRWLLRLQVNEDATQIYLAGTTLNDPSKWIAINLS
jgi:hypothetical protein